MRLTNHSSGRRETPPLILGVEAVKKVLKTSLNRHMITYNKALDRLVREETYGEIRYKKYDYSQGKFIPVHFDKQILPGTFEYTLHYLIDNEIDLSIFDARYENDNTGAPAYDPAILLKIILYAYSRGITSSRKIAQCCEENIIFMALSADTRPHFTTIADFISSAEIKTYLKRPSLWQTADIIPNRIL